MIVGLNINSKTTELDGDIAECLGNLCWCLSRYNAKGIILIRIDMLDFFKNEKLLFLWITLLREWKDKVDWDKIFVKYCKKQNTRNSFLKKYLID